MHRKVCGEKGSFTGAGERRIGRYELADGGTLFLDEVGEIPLDVQVTLLRVLQEGEFERVGGHKTIRVDVRLITATNRDLNAAMADGSFREDLYYCLNVFPLMLPPLRERPEDIPALVHYFVERFAVKIGRRVTRVPAAAMQRLTAYAWPGNVRELENVIERAVILSVGPDLDVASGLFTSIHTHPRRTPAVNPAHRGQVRVAGSVASLDNVERDHILAVLAEAQWRIEGPYGAAKLLGLQPSTLRSRMKKLNISRHR